MSLLIGQSAISTGAVVYISGNGKTLEPYLGLFLSILDSLVWYQVSVSGALVMAITNKIEALSKRGEKTPVT